MQAMPQKALILSGIMGATAVLLGAFGAHGLENSPIEAHVLEAYRTGAAYHLWHSLAVLGLAAAWDKLHPARARAALWCFGLGVLLFSGSLYGMGMASANGGSASFLGPITPLGGLLLTAGWVLLAWAAMGQRRTAA